MHDGSPNAARPDALVSRDVIARWRTQRPLALLLDFDGTLSPIVDDPGAAALPTATRHILVRLAARYPVAIISGRGVADVRARVDVPCLWYAGCHGLEIAGPRDETGGPLADADIHAVTEATRRLCAALGDVAGVVIEPKGFSVAVHDRQVSPTDVDRVRATAAACAAELGLRLRTGKRVRELVPDLDWDKGRASRWLLEAAGIEPRTSAVIAIGDDDTDEDTFAAVRDLGLTVRVGDPTMPSRAAYNLADPAAVAEFLRWLADG